MYRNFDQKQTFLLPPSVEDFLEETHPAHIINDLVEKLDIKSLEARYGKMGQPAYHPSLMVKVILYGFSVGVFSSRKLQRACRENLAFKYLSGMQTPAFKTFIEFRKRHRDDMRLVFVETVVLARKLGLAKLGSVALDGTKIEANTSKHKAMSYGRMQAEEKRLESEIEKLLKESEGIDETEDLEHGADNDGYSLPKELSRREDRLRKIDEAKRALEEREKKENPRKKIDSKKQISFADKDARCLSKRGDGTKYVYNSQACVDMESQIITENHIEESVHDAKAVEETLKNMETELGEKPGHLVGDSGYGNKNTVESCKSRGVVPVCATTREKKNGKESESAEAGHLDSFDYDQHRDKFTCTHGERFHLLSKSKEVGKSSYVSEGEVACGCGTRSLKVGRRVLEVRRSHLAKRELQRILEKKTYRELYKRRKCTVEPVFGQIKSGMGFRRYFYRGREKVRSEWNLVCAALNIRKIALRVRDGGEWEEKLRNLALSGAH